MAPASSTSLSVPRTFHGASTSAPSARSSRAFIQSLVPHLIPQLRVSPFLQAYRLCNESHSASPVSRAFHVDPSTSVAPELWASILQHLERQDRSTAMHAWASDLIVFAKELPHDRPRASRHGRPREECCVAGVTGDACCDDSLEFLEADDELLRAIEQDASSGGSAGPSEATKYYGIVLKPSGSARPDATAATVAGCYLLKTVAAMSAGCTCTHFSCTPVALGGASLYGQFLSHWLV